MPKRDRVYIGWHGAMAIEEEDDVVSFKEELCGVGGGVVKKGHELGSSDAL